MRYDIYGVGNALVDFEYTVTDDFLRSVGVAKGHMTLLDEARISALEQRLGAAGARPVSSMSGGSAANTIVAARGFGSHCAYVGRLGRDAAGSRFADDMRAAGIHLFGGRDAGATGRCVTLVTPDGERSMATCLGVSAALDAGDVEQTALANSCCLYVEGYLAAAAGGRRAAVLARQAAEAVGARTSLSLSDPSMVAGCRAGLEEMLGNGVRQLFCNEEEALTWAGADRIDIAINELVDIAPSVNVTLGARGSMVASRGGCELVPGYPATALDTTGAGDIYAGACLAALAAGADARDAARFGNFAAARLVGSHGPRLAGIASYMELKNRFRG